MIPRLKHLWLGLAVVAITSTYIAQSSAQNQSAPSKPPKISDGGRQLLMRTFAAELVFAKRYFPMGKVGLSLDESGKVTPGDQEVRAMVANFGPAAKPGDRVKITNIFIKGKSVIFEINGGPVKRKKWYERIQVGGNGGMAAPADKNPDKDIEDLNARGSYVALDFKDYVPELPMDRYRQMLAPVFDFNSMSAAEAYSKALPPIVQQAIKDHKALVGMDREMVVAAMGRPPRKYRDRAGDVDYEEWIYGQPPEEVNFVRFVQNRVVRIETMKVDGEKVIRATKEVDIDEGAAPTAVAKKDDTQPRQGPSLMRPGEKPVSATPAAPARTASPGAPDPSQSDPASAGKGNPGGMPMPGNDPSGMPPPNTVPH